MDSRLSMSGSSLTCRRYLATLDILAKWAAALARAVGRSWRAGTGCELIWTEQTPSWSRTSAPLPCLLQVPKCELGEAAASRSPGLVDPGWSSQQPIRPHDGPALEGEANPRAGAGLPRCQSCLKLEDIPGNLGALCDQI